MSNELIVRLKSLPDYIGGIGRSEEDIIACEQALRVRFAPDYREYLLEIGLACFDGRELTGISTSTRLDVVAVTNKMRVINAAIPADFYVIEEIGVDGVVAWQAGNGIIYKSPATGEPQEICKSLLEYIDM